MPQPYYLNSNSTASISPEPQEQTIYLTMSESGASPTMYLHCDGENHPTQEVSMINVEFPHENASYELVAFHLKFKILTDGYSFRNTKIKCDNTTVIKKNGMPAKGACPYFYSASLLEGGKTLSISLVNQLSAPSSMDGDFVFAGLKPNGDKLPIDPNISLKRKTG